MSLREDALAIALAAVKGALPYENTRRALEERGLSGDITLFAVGKAAVPMAKAAAEHFGPRLKQGLLVTKYEHLGGFSHPALVCMEAAHPVTDENGVLAARRAVALAKSLTANDTALFLLSGGGSALMEESAVPQEYQREITRQLLARGASIEEINALRKRLSLVKGGKLGAACGQAKVITLALSDVLSNDFGVIASGLTVPDETPDETLERVMDEYLPDMPELRGLLPPREDLRVNDAGRILVGDVGLLCRGACAAAAAAGYEAAVVDASLTGEARDTAADILKKTPRLPGKHAYIYAGETTVTLRGTGRGGRNQEMALAAAIALRGEKGVCFLSVGSDGTDGPTDAAGGIADGETCARMERSGVQPEAALANNDSYRALGAAGDLIVTGATGTNVNDLTLVLTGI